MLTETSTDRLNDPSRESTHYVLFTVLFTDDLYNMTGEHCGPYNMIFTKFSLQVPIIHIVQ